MVSSRSSGLVTILCQSEVVFDVIQKFQLGVCAKKRFFENFFSKCTRSKTNCHRDMKPTSNGQKYPKFSNDKKTVLAALQIFFEMFKLKVMGPLRLSDTSISSSSSLHKHNDSQGLQLFEGSEDFSSTHLTISFSLFSSERNTQGKVVDP